jgi:hypothetical protein
MKKRRKKRKLKTVITPETCPFRYCHPVFHKVQIVVLALLICVASFASDSTVIFTADHHQKKNEKPYALIFGTVWGPDDRPLYGVKLRIRRTDLKKGKWELYSDHHGEFAQRVPAGRADYVVTADLKDYKLNSGKRLQTASEVTVHIEGDERTDIGLHLKYQEL